MKLGIDFDAEPDDVFHSHGIAKAAYGARLGSTSPTPGGGRAGDGSVGAVGAYHYADISYRHKRDPAAKGVEPKSDNHPRGKLKVQERPDSDKGAAFSHRQPSEPTIRTFREPPGRSFNPYS